MKTQSLAQIVSMDNLALSTILEYWKRYEPKSVLLALAVLNKRGFVISERLNKKLDEFCENSEHSTIDNYLSSFFKENDLDPNDFYNIPKDELSSVLESKYSSLKSTAKFFSVINTIMGTVCAFGILRLFGIGDTLTALYLTASTVITILIFSAISGIIKILIDVEANTRKNDNEKI